MPPPSVTTTQYNDLLSTTLNNYRRTLEDNISNDTTALRRCDKHKSTIIAVMPAPVGLGHAIRDRLTKAAAPRTAD